MGYLIILIIVVFAVYYVVNEKKGKLEVFKRYNEEEKGIVNSIGDIRCFFDMRDEGEYTLDDQTWYDLNMDEVYRKIDRSYSSVGESVLYSMLRNPLTNKEEIVERGKKIEAINDDIDLRAKLKLIFFNLGYDKKNRFIEMIESKKEPNKAKYIIYNIMGKAIPIALI
ncbi:MAG: DNA mismatch repair protein MutS, partial [Clostridium sp.]